MSKLKVGIAGYGIVGKRRHLFINDHKSLKVTAVCEQNFSKGYNELTDVLCFNNYKDLLDQDLDILFVCLTNNVAAEVTIAGLEKGLHVFCEKPPGMNVDEIIKVIEVEKKLKIIFGFFILFSVLSTSDNCNSCFAWVIIPVRITNSPFL